VTPEAEYPLKTKRMVIGQITMCSGCCCGAVNRGKPEVPVEWLKQEWRSRGLLKNIQLTISCCLGPCDLPNVVKISAASVEIWLGNINRAEQYMSLVEWAERSKTAGNFIPLPDHFDQLRFDPFRPIPETSGLPLSAAS
jgi:cobaltochelatase CobN